MCACTIRDRINSQVVGTGFLNYLERGSQDFVSFVVASHECRQY